MNWIGMTLFERIRSVVDHADSIYVRAQVDGNWTSVALSEMPEADLIETIARLASRDVEPTRVVDRSKRGGMAAMTDNPECNEVWWVYSTQEKLWAGLRIATVIPATPAHGELFVIHNEAGHRIGIRMWGDVSEREGWVKVKKIDVPTSEEIIAVYSGEMS